MGISESYPPPPLSFVSPPVFLSGQHWVPPTSCHRGRVSPADGVRPAEDHVSQQHRLSSDCEFGTFCSQRLFFSLPLPPPSLYHSGILFFFLLLPSSLLLYPPHFSPFLTITPFSLFSLSLCSVWQRKKKGPK